MRVAVLGASAKKERYSYQALLSLMEAGHQVCAVNPALSEIAGLPVYSGLAELPEDIDTVTVYLSPANSGALLEALCALKPRRVIFNPGAENPAMYAALRQAGVQVQEACTLVLLRTGQF